MKITLFLLAAILVAIFFKMPADSDSASQNLADFKNAAAASDNSCFLTAEKCRFPIQNGFVELKIPQPIPAGKGFEIVLQAQDFQIESATASFEGLSMTMSAPEIVFSKNAQNNAIWQARAFLPICLTGTMRWRMTLRLNQNLIVPWLMESG